MEFVTNLKSGQKLAEAGLLSQRATGFELVVEMDRPVKMRSEVFLTREEYLLVLEELGSCAEFKTVSPGAIQAG